MLCPADDTPLAASASNGYEVHRCPQCLGVAVAGNVLPAVRAYAALELHKQPDQPAHVRPCPRDGKMMKSLRFKGVSMDVCPECRGLWLEAGQLPRLLEVTRPAGPVDLGRLAAGKPLMEEKLTFDWEAKLEGATLFMYCVAFLLKLWK